MSEEMKLITALCNALGFKVERTVVTTKGTEEREYPPIIGYGSNPFPSWEEYEFIGDGKYIEVKREVIFNLTKEG